ncbi:HD domain-containing protein [Flagellimonas sp.]|uniref:HD domain-containing protein n=1 Tax=Flagellimonas sp. TaxID=2058762 RepID=UPI003F49F56E
MVTTNKLKVFNDPIYGFIGTPNELIFDLIGHPYFQRLRRISQMGMSYLVYPGAHHTRFHHALGCMHLMTKAIQILRSKEVEISEEEETGLLCAILLHDIGHGPFSHALEGLIVENVSHEAISLKLMQALNQDFSGALEVAIQIFQGSYHRPFMNQLVSSQLDMDRLDYLKRDSFYAGVTEGNINSERLIFMLNVVEGNLVLEEKGIYAVEKFLMARRFMYWQVYLHKTGLVAEQVLIRIMNRAKSLLKNGHSLNCSDTLTYFLQLKQPGLFTLETLNRFTQLDDIDVLSALKNWQSHSDFVLSSLCKMLLNRKLPHIKMKNGKVAESKWQEKLQSVMETFNVSEDDASYFVFRGEVANTAYDESYQTINILKKNGKVTHLLKESDQLSLSALTKKVTKHYICYPK